MAATVKKEEEKTREEQTQEEKLSGIASIMGRNQYTPGDTVQQAQQRLNAKREDKPGQYSSRWQEQMDEGNGGPWLRRRTHGARQDENGQQQDKRQGASECLRLSHKRESCHSGAPPFQDAFSSRSCR